MTFPEIGGIYCAEIIAFHQTTKLSQVNKYVVLNIADVHFLDEPSIGQIVVYQQLGGTNKIYYTTVKNFNEMFYKEPVVKPTTKTVEELQAEIESLKKELKEASNRKSPSSVGNGFWQIDFM